MAHETFGCGDVPTDYGVRELPHQGGDRHHKGQVEQQLKRARRAVLLGGVSRDHPRSDRLHATTVLLV